MSTRTLMAIFAHPDEVVRQPWFRREHFILARSIVDRPAGVETDLFAGFR